MNSVECLEKMLAKAVRNKEAAEKRGIDSEFTRTELKNLEAKVEALNEAVQAVKILSCFTGAANAVVKIGELKTEFYNWEKAIGEKLDEVEDYAMQFRRTAALKVHEMRIAGKGGGDDTNIQSDK